MRDKRPPHLPSNVRDDRETPLVRAEDAQRGASDLPDVTSEDFRGTLARRANQLSRFSTTLIVQRHRLLSLRRCCVTLRPALQDHAGENMKCEKYSEQDRHHGLLARPGKLKRRSGNGRLVSGRHLRELQFENAGHGQVAPRDRRQSMSLAPRPAMFRLLDRPRPRRSACGHRGRSPTR
jgi:hypothetical protein